MTDVDVDPGLTEVTHLSQMSVAQQSEYADTLVTSHAVRTFLEILDTDEKHGFATSDVIDGGVTFDDASVPAGSLDVTVLDPDGRHFADAPFEEVIEARRFVRLVYEVKVGAGWHRCHVFTGPITHQRRQGAEVSIQAVTKEALYLDPAFAWESANYGRKRRLRDVVHDIAAAQGERHFRLGEDDRKVHKPIVVARLTEPWPKIVLAARKMGKIPYFDGSGYLALRPRVENRVAWTFDPEALLSNPEFDTDFTEIRNQSAVQGPDPDGPQLPMAVSAALPPGHPLSPQRMARSGVPRRLIVLDEIESRREAVLKNHARGLLTSFAVNVAFDCLPVPHLRLGHLCRLRGNYEGSSIDMRFPLRRYFVPATVTEPATIGYWRRLPLNWGKHRVEVRRIKPWDLPKPKKKGKP